MIIATCTMKSGFLILSYYFNTNTVSNYQKEECDRVNLSFLMQHEEELVQVTLNSNYHSGDGSARITPLTFITRHCFRYSSFLFASLFILCS